jgi:REP element-mobilizing transposase RayT
MHPLPQRRSPRLKGYDYRQEGAYFVTICTRIRVHLFGEIADDQMQLNQLGVIAASYWEEIPTHFPHVELDAAVVMPNHVHGIIVIMDRPHPLHEAISIEVSGSSKQGSLSTVVGSYKAGVTRQIRRLFPDAETPIWQGRFHDHIIRSQESLDIIRAYVLNNPARWTEDTFYSA